MTASIELLFAPAADGNPLHGAKMRLITQLARLPVPAIDVCPTADQIESVGDFILGLGALVDTLMLTIGEELRANATLPIRLDNFTSPMRNAVDGFALYDVQCVADELRSVEMLEA